MQIIGGGGTPPPRAPSYSYGPAASVNEEGHVKGYFHDVFWPFFIFLQKIIFLLSIYFW